jgi:carboxypeptidase Taq
LQQHGSFRKPAETVEHACGFAPSAGPLLDYLDAKFRAIYRL